jgi:hypothetical protein
MSDNARGRTFLCILLLCVLLWWVACFLTIRASGAEPERHDCVRVTVRTDTTIFARFFSTNLE